MRALVLTLTDGSRIGIVLATWEAYDRGCAVVDVAGNRYTVRESFDTIGLLLDAQQGSDPAEVAKEIAADVERQKRAMYDDVVGHTSPLRHSSPPPKPVVGESVAVYGDRLVEWDMRERLPNSPRLR